ncbi:putative bicyclomycin resistance protein [Trichodelitschia bisporula]|uniref:Putative bicyclomycin resistance protein n=1 Tax=Trichodelitschia bisporula TaxID=703511 RepID=A0A6G1HUR5_9PEZI|nr:putative bicyclomycin resistance protein [Trichodelitschia bisporula]
MAEMNLKEVNSAEEAPESSRESLPLDLEKGSTGQGEASKELTELAEPEKAHTHGGVFSAITHHTTHHTAPSIRHVTTAQDWDGLDDPENPMNWPLGLKIYHTIIPALLAFVVTFGSSVYSPGYPLVAKEFHVSKEAAILPLSLYVIGLGLGPAIAAPISETYGRLPVYQLSLPLSMLFTLGAGFSKSYASLMVCRFFAGTFGSPVLAIGGGTNADMYPPRSRAISTAFFIFSPFMGPALGPIIGGFAAQYKGWRWTQWCILFVSVAVYAAGLPMKETYKKVLLQRRAKKLNLAPPKENMPTGWARFKFFLAFTLLRPFHMLFFEPIVGFLSLYSAFTFGLLFAYFVAFPYVFIGTYHFTTAQSGLAFVSIGIGCMLSVVTTILTDNLIYQKEHHKAQVNGTVHVSPEHRLYTAMMGSVGVSVGLFWFAWTARRDVHWAVPIASGIPFAWGNLSIFTSSALYVIDTYGPMNGSSAIAANGFARYIAGAAFPLFTVQMYHRLGIDWATSLLGFLSLLMLPIPWALYKWGPKIRKTSHYPTIKA